MNFRQMGDTARISYKKFEKVILDFQMKSHEKFLSRFLQCYRQVDRDNNGIIEEVLIPNSPHPSRMNFAT